jgi:hypothetical protein
MSELLRTQAAYSYRDSKDDDLAYLITRGNDLYITGQPIFILSNTAERHNH